ncbi:hypothetical protein [Delftia acidovorans]|uniref:hypothetical protein n=1 Tax=Delftia acidovorans TaxID=80866 RepID=UPI00286EF653|nr:hypothetical protein [Delftia acidovorans]
MLYIALPHSRGQSMEFYEQLSFDSLREKLGENNENSPIINVSGKLSCKFDAISAEIDPVKNVVTLRVLWHDQRICEMPQPLPTNAGITVFMELRPGGEIHLVNPINQPPQPKRESGFSRFLSRLFSN